MKKISTLLALMLTMSMAFIAVGAVTRSASATQIGADEGCTWLWTRSIPQSHTVAKYKKQVTYYTVEHKKVRSTNGWTGAEITWLKSRASKIGSGSDATSEWTLNDATVNSANVNPFDLPQQRWTDLPNGLGAYGGPSSSDVDYFITSFDTYLNLPSGVQFYQTHSGTVYYTGGDPNTGFSNHAGDAMEVTSANAPAGWTKYGELTVQDLPLTQGPIRSANEPDRGNYPNVPWVKDGSSKVCPDATDATASVSVTQSTCVDGKPSAPVITFSITNASTATVKDTSVGTHTANFVADAGHAFPAGPGVTEAGKKKAVEYTVDAGPTKQECTTAPPTEYREVPNSTQGCDLPGYGAGVLSWTDVYETTFGWVEESGTYIANPESGPVIKEGSTNFAPYSDDEFVTKNCNGDVPTPKTVYGEWQDGTWSCGDTTVEQTRTMTVTPFVWDLYEREWVEGDPIVTVETRMRDLTAQEQFACPIPVQFDAPASPTPPACDTAGSFSLPGDSEFIEWSIDPEFTGPDTYTVTATLVGDLPVWADGFEDRSRPVEITVEGATGFQSENPEAPCFKALPTDNPPTVNPPTVNPPTHNTPTDNTPTHNTPTHNTPVVPTSIDAGLSSAPADDNSGWLIGVGLALMTLVAAGAAARVKE